MPTATKTVSANVAGLSFRQDTTHTDEGTVALEVAASQLNAGVSGTLSTRTSGTEGIITSSSHGILDTATIDIVWSGGKRYGVDIDSATSSTITFSGGAGDDLPDASTAVTAGEIVNAVVEFDGDDCALFGMDSAGGGLMATFKDSGGSALANFHLYSSNDYTYIWNYGGGITNPLTGNAVASVDLSCDSTAVKFRLGVLKSGVS